MPLLSCVCVCVCSGHIPHHKCCSVYVLSRVQFAFHTTQFHTTLNIFKSHIIPSHHTKRFYTTPPFTSHHSTPPFHITPPLHNIPHHITTYRMFHATSLRHLMSQHISPRTTIFYIWHHITPQSASHHHFTPPHLKAQHSTSHKHSPHRTIPDPQLFHTTPTFNTTAHFTPHHIPHRIPPHLDFTSSHQHSWHHNTLHHFPHLTSHNHSTLHMPHSSSPQFHTTTFHIT